MADEQKTLMRAAARIHEGLIKRRANPRWELPNEAWSELTMLDRQIGLARQRGWRGAASVRMEDLAVAADAFQHKLAKLSGDLRSQLSTVPLATEADIYRDLLALRDEFENVSCDLEDHEVCVTTTPIKLEGMNFGPFEIRLDWNKLEQPPAYRAVALDSNPSSQREEVTHPHVCNEYLCEGDGTTAIQSALRQGRIGDFFLIILNLLRTYSQGNAFVELDDWNGCMCSICECYTSADSSYSCDSCGCTLCEDCPNTCNSCGNLFCAECILTCAQCNVSCCSACLQGCSECDAKVCDKCLEDGLCKACFKNRQASEAENEGPSTIASGSGGTAAAIQPDGMGQVAVLARPRDERGRWVRRVAA